MELKVGKTSGQGDIMRRGGEEVGFRVVAQVCDAGVGDQGGEKETSYWRFGVMVLEDAPSALQDLDLFRRKEDRKPDRRRLAGEETRRPPGGSSG